MTDDKIALRSLLEKASDATFLRDMIGFAAERLKALETEALCGAAPGERSADRINQRKGYRDRDWQTRAGTVPVMPPVRPRPPRFSATQAALGIRWIRWIRWRACSISHFAPRRDAKCRHVSRVSLGRKGEPRVEEPLTPTEFLSPTQAYDPECAQSAIPHTTLDAR